MLIDQRPPPERTPHIELFQIVLKLAGQTSACRSLCFHPLRQRIRKQIRVNSVFFAFEKLAMEPRRGVKCAHGVGSMMEPRTTQRVAFDDNHLETFFCCKEGPLATSRPGTY